MPLTKEEIIEAKKQLSEQIKHLPPQQKQVAQAQINSLSEEAIEEMINQQKTQQKIFRMIISGEIPSVKIDENTKAIAVLSVKSISQGHTLIIPKKPLTGENSMPEEIHKLSEQISKKLISGLGAKSTQVFPEKAFGEVILNVIPIYDSPLSLQSPRQDVSKEELEKIKSKLNVIKIEKKPAEIIKEEKKQKEILKLKRRIP